MFHSTAPLRSRSRFFRPNDGHRPWDRPRRHRWAELLGHARRIKRHARVRGCTLATLKGQFLFADAGTLLPPFVPEPTLSAYAGFHVFNGDGTGTDVITGRAGGQIVLDNVVSPISYSVNRDCTGSLTVIGGPTFGLFIAIDGESIATIATGPGSFGANISQRASRK